MTDLDLSEQIARIERAQIETQKFAAEQRKLTAEAAKFDRDRVLAPWLVLVAVAGGLGGILAGVVTLLRLTGRIS